MTGGTPVNRVAGDHGGDDQHGRTARGRIGSGGALPIGKSSCGPTLDIISQVAVLDIYFNNGSVPLFIPPGAPPIFHSPLPLHRALVYKATGHARPAEWECIFSSQAERGSSGGTCAEA